MLSRIAKKVNLMDGSRWQSNVDINCYWQISLRLLAIKRLKGSTLLVVLTTIGRPETGLINTRSQ